MKGKLIKKGEELYSVLYVTDNSTIEHNEMFDGKISLKNCQAIERGYDLDEIKRKLFNGFDGQHDSFTIAAVERTVEIMLEIIGHKKFSEEDMYVAFSMGRDHMVTRMNKYIDRIHGCTEWDVEIQTEPYVNNNFINDDKADIIDVQYKPKLDAYGCLIMQLLN